MRGKINEAFTWLRSQLLRALGWLQAKGRFGVGVASAALAAIMILGVGTAMAVTGSLPNFGSEPTSPPVTSGPSEEKTSSGTGGTNSETPAGDQSFPDDGKVLTADGANSETLRQMQKNGWTGMDVAFSAGRFGIIMGIKPRSLNDTMLSGYLMVNGYMVTTYNVRCAQDPNGACVQAIMGTLQYNPAMPNALCRASGDMYEATMNGGGQNIVKRGVVPSGIIDCSAKNTQQTQPQPQPQTPTPSPEPPATPTPDPETTPVPEETVTPEPSAAPAVPE